MKYHFIDGAEKKRQWWKPLAWVVPVLLVAAGGYILFTALSPSLINVPLLDSGNTAETEERLQSKPGTYGDRLFIPQIGVDVAILVGNESVLDKGAWHRKPENGDPITGGNFVLSAHRFEMGLTPQQTRAKSPFYNIGNLQVGAQIFVDYKGERYGYEITKKYSVKPTQVEIEAPSEQPKMTLYSCTLEGSADGRDVLEAKPLGKVEKMNVSTLLIKYFFKV